MGRRIKDMLIADITSRIGDVQDMLVVDCSGLDAVTANRWRMAITKSGISVLTVKNSIAKNALARLGVEGLAGILSGPSTLLWGGEDVVALSREISKWAKELHGLKIKGGTVEGQALDAAAVETLVKSPGRQELISQIAGLMVSPGQWLVGALLGPGGRLAGALDAVSDGEGDDQE